MAVIIIHFERKMELYDQHHTLCSSPNMTRRTVHVARMARVRNVLRVLVGNPERKICMYLMGG
jgi:hypothetical protein